MDEVVAGKQPRKRRRYLGDGKRQNGSVQRLCRRNRGHEVVDREGQERRRRDTGKGVDIDRSNQTAGGEVDGGHDAEGNQPQHCEETQAELLAELHGQKVHRDERHHIDRGNPCGFRRTRTERSEEVGGIGKDKRVAESCSQTEDRTHDAVGDAPRQRMRRPGRTAWKDRPVVRREFHVVVMEES